MYCKECGTQIDDDSKFCVKCGTKQSSQPNQPESKTKRDTTQIKDSLKKVIKPITKKPVHQKSPLDEKYDNSYKRDSSPIIVGILWWILSFLSLTYREEVWSDDDGTLLGILFFTLLIFTNWGWRIAKAKNRDELGWAIFVFILSPLALIILGTKKKFLYTSYYHSLDDKEKSKETSNIAISKMNAYLYNESIIFSSKSIEQNKENPTPYKTRGYCKYLMKDYSGALIDMNTYIELASDDMDGFYKRGLIYIELGEKQNAINDLKLASENGNVRAQSEIEKINI